MPKTVDTRFVRQSSTLLEKIGMVIPQNAKITLELRKTLSQLDGIDLTATNPPHSFSFHYVDCPIDAFLLDNGAIINNRVHEFLVRDAIIGVFDLPAFQNDEFCWSFSSTYQINILAALRIGETFDVTFDEELDQVFHVTKYHFPSSVPNSGYGQYAIHLNIDGLNTKGFRVVSSYEPQSERTQSRLPFFFGFRVFGKAKDDNEDPIWRELLGQSVRQALFQRWQHSLLYSAFSLESFIDERLAAKLDTSKVGGKYIDHILQVGEKRYELQALNNEVIGLSNTEVNRLYEKLNKNVFIPRNRLAHGKVKGSEITDEMAVRAIKTTVEFIWDWDKEARLLLLPKMKPFQFEDLIDEDLLRACQNHQELEK